jgi:hypothetical protein
MFLSVLGCFLVFFGGYFGVFLLNIGSLSDLIENLMRIWVFFDDFMVFYGVFLVFLNNLWHLYDFKVFFSRFVPKKRLFSPLFYRFFSHFNTKKSQKKKKIAMPK